MDKIILVGVRNKVLFSLPAPSEFKIGNIISLKKIKNMYRLQN